MKIKNKARMVAARVTEAEYNLIDKEAHKRGQRKSQYVREIILQSIYGMRMLSTVK